MGSVFLTHLYSVKGKIQIQFQEYMLHVATCREFSLVQFSLHISVLWEVPELVFLGSSLFRIRTNTCLGRDFLWF